MSRPGDRLLGHYILVEQLGEGAGGVTWRAEGPEGTVAIKFVQGENRRRRADLLREVHVLRNLRHPHIVAYREFADQPYEDRAVLVTDHEPGGDLEQWVFRHGRQPTLVSVGFGLQIVSALEALHAVGILHRDLKPANVLVAPTSDGLRLRVADFGISLPLRDGKVHTHDRSLTPAYAAPEQLNDTVLTAAADLYALGGVLAFVSTGGTSTEPRDVAAPLRHVIAALKDPVPEQRPTLAQTRAALEALSEGRKMPPLEPPPRAPATPKMDPVRVRALVMGFGCASGIIAGSLFAASLWASRGAASLEPVSALPAARIVEPEPPSASPEVSREAPLPPPVTAHPPARARPEPTRYVELRINSRPWSWVHVDGRRLGRTTSFGASFTLPAGWHAIKLVPETGPAWERRIDLRADHRLCVQLRIGKEIEC